MYQDEVHLNRMDPNELQTGAEETDEQTTRKSQDSTKQTRRESLHALN
jgi:hypothetical protein